MVSNEGSGPTPAALGDRALVELIAAIVAAPGVVRASVTALAPRTSEAVLAELGEIAAGRVAPGAASPAVRWILPEVHRDVAALFRIGQC